MSFGVNMHLQIAKWANSLAVRIPAAHVRQTGLKEGDQLLAQRGTDGTLHLSAL